MAVSRDRCNSLPPLNPVLPTVTGPKGAGGTRDNPCGYIAPVGRVAIPPKGEYSFSAFFTLGNLEQIRGFAYGLHGKQVPKAWSLAD